MAEAQSGPLLVFPSQPILASAFIGFASLAKGAGLTMAQSIFMTGAVWALPAHVVLVGAIILSFRLRPVRNTPPADPQG